MVENVPPALYVGQAVANENLAVPPILTQRHGDGAEREIGTDEDEEGGFHFSIFDVDAFAFGWGSVEVVFTSTFTSADPGEM